MSKNKSTKRKSTSLLKPDLKLPAMKTDTPLQDAKTEKNSKANSDQSSLPSCSKTVIKTESPVGSCYESAVNFSSNRESDDAFSSYMKNAILEEVLNAKKAALLQSPAVMKLLREEQVKKQKKE